MKSFQPDIERKGKIGDTKTKPDFSNLDFSFSASPNNDEIMKQLWFRPNHHDDPTNYQLKINELSKKYPNDIEKIRYIVNKYLEDTIIPSIASVLRISIIDILSEEEDENSVFDDFIRLINQWSEIGLDKNRILESEEIFLPKRTIKKISKKKWQDCINRLKSRLSV